MSLACTTFSRLRRLAASSSSSPTNPVLEFLTQVAKEQHVACSSVCNEVFAFFPLSPSSSPSSSSPSSSSSSSSTNDDVKHSLLLFHGTGGSTLHGQQNSTAVRKLLSPSLESLLERQEFYDLSETTKKDPHCSTSSSAALLYDRYSESNDDKNNRSNNSSTEEKAVAKQQQKQKPPQRAFLTPFFPIALEFASRHRACVLSTDYEELQEFVQQEKERTSLFDEYEDFGLDSVSIDQQLLIAETYGAPFIIKSESKKVKAFFDVGTVCLLRVDFLQDKEKALVFSDFGPIQRQTENEEEEEEEDATKKGKEDSFLLDEKELSSSSITFHEDLLVIHHNNKKNKDDHPTKQQEFHTAINYLHVDHHQPCFGILRRSNSIRVRVEALLHATDPH